MNTDYILTEARDGDPGESFYALGHRWTKEGDGVVRFMTPLIPREAPEGLPALLPDQIPRMALGLRQFWDAAYPSGVTVNTEGVAYYEGGGTPHPWTDAEIEAALVRSSAQFLLPIFVRVPPTTRDPVVEANWFVDRVEARGMPKGTVLALDYETSTVREYLAKFDAQVVARGYLLAVYGSLSTVRTLPAPSGGRWPAHWNNTPHVCPEGVMTQYGGDPNGEPYDINLASDPVKFWYPGGTPDMTIEELRKEITTPGTPTRIAFLSLMQRGVNSTVGAQDVDTDGAASPARKAISALVKAEVAPLMDDEAKFLAAVSALAEVVATDGVDEQRLVDILIQAAGPVMSKAMADEVYRRMEA